MRIHFFDRTWLDLHLENSGDDRLPAVHVHVRPKNFSVFLAGRTVVRRIAFDLRVAI